MTWEIYIPIRLNVWLQILQIRRRYLSGLQVGSSGSGFLVHRSEMMKWSGVAKWHQSSEMTFSGGLFVRNPIKIDILCCPSIRMGDKERLQRGCWLNTSFFVGFRDFCKAKIQISQSNIVEVFHIMLCQGKFPVLLTNCTSELTLSMATSRRKW